MGPVHQGKKKDVLINDDSQYNVGADTNLLGVPLRNRVPRGRHGEASRVSGCEGVS